MDGNGVLDPAIMAGQESMLRLLASKERVWSDDNPFWLQIWRPEGIRQDIDLGESGWMKTYAEWMRGRARWMMVDKQTGRAVFVLDVFEGEQPYYTARHVGVTGGGGSNEITAYGIGKKRLDGHTDRLWVLPTGEVCAGDDVDTLGQSIVLQMGPRR